MIYIYLFIVNHCFSKESGSIPPPPYAGISSVFLKETNTFYFLSGYSSASGYLPGTQQFFYNNKTGSWQYKPEQDPTYPPMRALYGSFMYNNNYYAFAGIGPQGILKDMWCYNIANDFWVQITMQNSIARRYNFAYTSFIYNDEFYFAVAGGRSNNNPENLDDFYLYNVEKNYWTQLSPISQCVGFGLFSAQLQYNDGKIYLFGGVNLNRNNLTYFTDLCVYELSDFVVAKWSLIQLSGLNRTFNQAGSCISENKIYAFYGVNSKFSSPVPSNEILRLNLLDSSPNWESLRIKGCDDSQARASFGFTCISNSVYINGGTNFQQNLNSAIRLEFDHSKADVACEVLFDNLVWPSRRNGASLLYISGKLILFAGQDQGNVFSDIWYIDLDTLKWTQPVTFGSYPVGRYLHGAASQGKYMIIHGGLNKDNEILQDFYLLDTNSWYWTLINGLNNIQPPPSYSSCLVLNFPKVYIIGGVQVDHTSLNLWVLDLDIMVFMILYQYDPANDLGLQGHSCFLQESGKELKIVALFGSTNLNDDPFNGAAYFNLAERPIKPKIVMNLNTELEPRSHFVLNVLSNDYVLIAGGESYKQVFFDDIWAIRISDFSAYNLGNLFAVTYLASGGFFNSTLFVFSGFSNNGFSMSSPSSEFFSILDLKKNSVFNLLNFKCGLGQQENDKGECELCSPGTYNPNYNSSACLLCPAGTYNHKLGATNFFQCIPCSFGYYSNQGSSSCIKCHNSSVCFSGSDSSNVLDESSQKKLKDFGDYKEQPKMIEPEDISNITAIIFYVCLGIIIVFSLVFCLDYRIRIFLSYYDLFKNLHFEFHSTSQGSYVERETHLTPSKLGGYMTIVTIIILGYLVCNSIITYVLTNETEEVILVPINSLLDDSNFSSEPFKVTLMFASYRGDCSFDYLNLTTSSNLDIYYRKCEYSKPFCYFYIKGKLLKVVDTDYILFQFNDTQAYTSDISLRVETESSVPSKNSVVSKQLIIKEEVFRGTDPSIFDINFLPAYFHESGTFMGISHHGYILSSSTVSSKGSTVTPDEVAISNGLNILAYFKRIEIGYSYYKYPEVTIIDFLFAIINQFPGTIVWVGFLIWLIELIANYSRGKTSGRMKLAKRSLKSEKIRRKGLKNEGFLEHIN